MTEGPTTHSLAHVSFLGPAIKRVSVLLLSGSFPVHQGLKSCSLSHFSLEIQLLGQHCAVLAALPSRQGLLTNIVIMLTTGTSQNHAGR